MLTNFTRAMDILALIEFAMASEVQTVPISEPFPLLNGFNSTGAPAVPESPDPLVRYTWPAGFNVTGLQRYEVNTPASWLASPPTAFTGLDSLASSKPKVKVVGAGALRMDFGRERAAWFEFESPDLSDQAAHVSAAISEYNEPWQVNAKVRPVTAYSNSTFRLETNPELYEGVRFAWIFFDPPRNLDFPRVWTITSVRLQAMTKPVNYTGSFNSSDPVLTKSWYSGAYGTRLNMMPYGFNSILMERGDRVSIQGDGHPTMAAALTAFGSKDTYDLVHLMLKKTDSGCNGCRVVDDTEMSYPICWTMSVNDWFWASGDVKRFLVFAPDMATIIDKAVGTFLKPKLHMGFLGWDDRIDNGFCGVCNEEAQLAFAALVVRACGDFGRALKHAGDTKNATRYFDTATRLGEKLRSRPSTRGGPWYSDYGVHAASYLVNARVVATPEETHEIVARVLNDSTTICSWSPFNTYWIIQALGNAGYMAHATAAAKLCWGPMTALGTGCFWEIFSPESANYMNPGDKAPTSPSYCHPWSSGVTHWLSQNLGGIWPLEPGFGRFAALPHVSAYTPEVNVIWPTPRGSICVAAFLNIKMETLAVVVDSPVVGLLGLRHIEEASGCKLNLTSVTVDGVRAKESATGNPAELDVLHPIRAKGHAFFMVPARKCTITAAYNEGCAPSITSAAAKYKADSGEGYDWPNAPPFPPAAYPASWSTDRATAGDWIGKYGQAGYLLFGFDSDGTDVEKLPSWVRSVSMYNGHGRSFFVGADRKNASFLEDPAKKGRRALGFLTDAEPNPYFGADGSQGTVLNINVTAGTAYKLALYLVGNMRANGTSTRSAMKQAIRVMNLETLNPVAPEAGLEGSETGMYWVLKYDRGVRLRLMEIDGDAGCSALFFDLDKDLVPFLV